MRFRTDFPGLLITLILLTGLCFGYATYKQIDTYDFIEHVKWSKELARDEFIFLLPHTLFGKLVIIIRTILPFGFFSGISPHLKGVFDKCSYEISAILLVTLSHIATTYIVWKRSKVILNKNLFHSFDKLRFVSTILTVFVAPIFIFTYQESIYLGYISPNVFHNPTTILLKPFALLLFYLMADNFFSKSSITTLLYTFIISFLAATTKPNFTMSIIPSIIITYLIFYRNKKREVNWGLIFGGIFSISIIVLGAQFLLTFAANEKSQILISPLTSLLLNSPNLYIGVFKILMSILFPFYITIVFWKDVSQEITFRLGWINYLISQNRRICD